jgi:hypothetical protein
MLDPSLTAFSLVATVFRHIRIFAVYCERHHGLSQQRVALTVGSIRLECFHVTGIVYHVREGLQGVPMRRGTLF